MANALVLIELKEEAITLASLQALNLGRRLATRLGASLYALVTCTQTPSYGEDDIVAVLSRHGADKVVMVTNASLAHPLFYETHQQALLQACRQLPPQLLLLPASPTSHEVGPRLALALDGHYLGDVTVSIDTSDNTVHVQRGLFAKTLESRAELATLPRPLVLGLAPIAEAPVPLGVDEAELVVLQAPTEQHPRLEVLGPAAGPPCGSLTFVAGSHLAPATREAVAVAAERTNASHYQIQGSSGGDGPNSLALLAADVIVGFGVARGDLDPQALSAHSIIISVGQDPSCPLRRVAQYVVDQHPDQVLESLLGALDGSGT